ncbi:HEAT repeat domain-containing protein [Halorubrum ezzemoulense]|uniref:HEAT repeat domain-containing protein n=1 Tax=Halorubrum ezzemoulense TaxID=337243 RepID=A0ABT4Z1W6_HALEZ|nr:HEAT repeat domain-containing protein [Halorubrum ezzemoulense]MDB2243905.1 HEAT repeat domain-containing protein [Halorubrum ezzemoulense]MDB2251971.1 HEAT repeat domain-containing protein [Halorubrum ezzemoulense]MDB2277641.1 HEAT repeat domain-containing protein [Halorubrum ezzemoulense]MDB2284351.1 HEAT repeat domain-containing protein [Halorubrum ezzemoulense]MDB2289268.1 HEAT repeat domain-containing protein [Halorubrum ezzemoulense]
MSNGDDDPADAADDGEPAETAAPTLPDDATEESLTEYLDEIADRLEAAETEADLDDVEALLADAETGIDEADLPEPDEDDEDADDPRGDLEDRVAELRDGVDDARGPYGEDVVDAIESAAGTVEDTEWTDDGREDVAAAVESFVDAAADAIDDALGDADEDPEALLAEGEAADAAAPAPVDQLVAALDAVAGAVTDADLDADDDADDIAALLDATDELEAGLDDAEEWDDLETHEQLRAQGYYDVLGHYKDFPVEWAALKEHEARGNVDMILLALDSLQSEFMERHCLEAFERMGKRGKTEASVEEILGRAEKRDQPAIRILGTMAAEEATDTLVEYVPEDSNPQLQKVVFKTLGEIGASEAVQPLANQLDPDGDTDELVRPHAARALGLIGDTRAVDPLADALEAHPSDDVRAAAGWALRQIGTREALEAVAEYADEHSFVVSTEGEKARDALDDEAEPAPTA